MRKPMYMYWLIGIAGLVLVLVFVFVVPRPLTGEKISSPTLKWQPESAFTANVKLRFWESQFAPQFASLLNFERAVSVTAIPMSKSPVAQIRELEARPTTIGALYLPSGSLRLNLAPGVYRVEVAKKADGWRARFLDDKGDERGRTIADVWPADAIAIPIATVEYSVCYRFDNTVVCI